MSALKLPEIINISKATETKSKNFIIHLTKAQWKKTISKAVIYKGKKKFSEFAKNVFSFNEIEGMNGGLITSYSIDDKGKKVGLFPFVETIGKEKIIVYKKKRGTGGTNTSKCRISSSGGSMHCTGSCSPGRRCLSIIDPQSNKIAACLCMAPAPY